MSASFFSLPVEVFQGPVLAFLTPNCLSLLDFAVAKKGLRKELLEYFTNAVVRNVEEDQVFLLNQCSLRWVLSRKLYFTNVSVGVCGMHEYSDALSSVVAHASHVDCGFGALHGDYIVPMLKNCQELRSLTVSYNDGITDEVLSAITTQHSQLKVLNIASCEDMTSNVLRTIARNCTSLERLDIGSNGFLDANLLACTLCMLPNLRWLDVTTASFMTAHWHLVFDHCSLLEHINMSFTNFSAATIMYMGSKCTHIRSVCMHGEGDDFKVSALAHALPNLQELDLLDSCYLTPIGIVLLAKNCKGLRKLELQSCPCVNNDVLIALAENCPELTHLDCTHAGREATEESIVLLAQGCPKLETIILPYIDITDVSLIALAHHCPQLETVHMFTGTTVTDAGIIALSTHCAGLRSLNLSDCIVTDAALMSLAAHQPGLRELTLEKCKKLTSAGLVALAESCKNLSSLKITKCRKISDTGAIAVVQHCRRLRTLELTGLPAVTNAFVDVCIAVKIRSALHMTGVAITPDKFAQLEQVTT